MPFISTPSADSSEATAEMYASAEKNYGYLPNMHRVFGHRPAVMEKWSALLSSIRDNMSLRRYEIVTLAAARELKSSYCMLAHGSVLLREGFSETQLSDTVTNGSHAPLDDAEREIMAFAAKVARDASAVTEQDVARLRAADLSDSEIFDIAAAAAARCFFSKILDAMGDEPDPAYRERLSPALAKTLTVGRSIQGTFDPAKAAS